MMIHYREHKEVKDSGEENKQTEYREGSKHIDFFLLYYIFSCYLKCKYVSNTGRILKIKETLFLQILLIFKSPLIGAGHESRVWPSDFSAVFITCQLILEQIEQLWPEPYILVE